jgi:glycosyltransferase involved in cell wall biosynthesis
VARHVIDLVRYTAGVDHHVALPPRGVHGEARAFGMSLRDAGASLHVVDLRRNPLHLAAFAGALALNRLIRRLAPDVVHAHSSVAGAVVRTCAPPRSGVLVYTPHGLAPGRPAAVIERFLGHRRTDCFVALSPSEAERIGALEIVPMEKVRVIPNGVDLDQPSGAVVDLRVRFGLPPGTPLVGCLARLVSVKAPDVFVQACAEVARRRSDVHFVLIGEGPLQGLVDDEVGRSGMRGRFHRMDGSSGAAALLGQLDVFALLSRSEAGPYAPLEAALAGAPTVLSDVVGNRDVVQDGVSGFLAPFGDVDATAGAIVRLLGDDDLRRSFVRAANERLRARFDVRTMGASWATLYQELASSPAGRGRQTAHRAARV